MFRGSPDSEDLTCCGQVEAGHKDVAGQPEAECQHGHAPTKPDIINQPIRNFLTGWDRSQRCSWSTRDRTPARTCPNQTWHNQSINQAGFFRIFWQVEIGHKDVAGQPETERQHGHAPTKPDIINQPIRIFLTGWDRSQRCSWSTRDRTPAQTCPNQTWHNQSTNQEFSVRLRQVTEM
jgi:hypothetical protein